jgi:hypothetical protein
MGYGDTKLSQIEAAPIKRSIRKPGNRGTSGKEKFGAGRPAPAFYVIRFLHLL